MKSLVTGSTGFIGSHLLHRLDHPIAVGRNLEKIRQRLGNVDARIWDPGRTVEPAIFSGVETVFHLAGESVYHGRWNPTRKDAISKSRVETTRRIVEGMAACTQPPKTFICSSAIGFYGHRGSEELSESAEMGHDFLAEVCGTWEQEALRAQDFGVRVVCVRTGVVLGRDGGALTQMLPPFKIGLGGRLGNGQQYMSWIHIDDLVGILLYAAEHKEISGPVNGTAPEAVTNAEFTRILARTLHRPALFPVPASLLRLVVGEFAAVLLASQRVVPEKIGRAGYRFLYPTLAQALADLLSSE